MEPTQAAQNFVTNINNECVVKVATLFKTTYANICTGAQLNLPWALGDYLDLLLKSSIAFILIIILIGVGAGITQIIKGRSI